LAKCWLTFFAEFDSGYSNQGYSFLALTVSELWVPKHFQKKMIFFYIGIFYGKKSLWKKVTNIQWKPTADMLIDVQLEKQAVLKKM